MENEVEVFLSIGSNMGDRLKNLSNAVLLMEEKGVFILKKSSIYESEAWGLTDQNDFLNQIISIKTSYTAQKVLQIAQKIELELGRVRENRWGPRTIDIDIIFYNNQIIKEEDLTIPHKEMANRVFVLKPLEEVAPNFVHPILKRTIKNLLETCKDSLSVELYKW